LQYYTGSILVYACRTYARLAPLCLAFASAPPFTCLVHCSHIVPCTHIWLHYLWFLRLDIAAFGYLLPCPFAFTQLPITPHVTTPCPFTLRCDLPLLPALCLFPLLVCRPRRHRSTALTVHTIYPDGYYRPLRVLVVGLDYLTYLCLVTEHALHGPYITPPATAARSCVAS